MTCYESFEASQAKWVPKVQRRCFRETMWPPDNSSELQLQRCMRLLPHLNDTGGFFVALLRKVSPLVAPSRFHAKPQPDFQHRKGQMACRLELVPHEVLAPLIAHFGFKEDFLREIMPGLHSFAPKWRTISYVAPGLRKLLRGETIGTRKLRQVWAGAKVIELESSGRWLLSQEGATLFAPFASKQCVALPDDDIKTLVQREGRWVYSEQLSREGASRILKDAVAGACIITMLKGDGVVLPAEVQLEKPWALRIVLNLMGSQGREHAPQALLDAALAKVSTDHSTRTAPKRSDAEQEHPSHTSGRNTTYEEKMAALKASIAQRSAFNKAHGLSN